MVRDFSGLGGEEMSSRVVSDTNPLPEFKFVSEGCSGLSIYHLASQKKTRGVSKNYPLEFIVWL